MVIFVEFIQRSVNFCNLLSGALIADDAAKADMARRGVDWFGVTRGRTIAAAIVGRAQMRAALEHLARYLYLGLAGIVARGFGPAARVLRDTAGLWRLGRMLWRIPVSGPFPNIADRVVKAVPVCREG